MPELVAENVTIYKIPSISLDASHDYSAFLTTTSDNYLLGVLKQENPEIKKFFEGLSEGSVFLDRLYSISDIQMDWSKLCETQKKLPESHEIIPVSKEEFEEQYRKVRDKFEKSEMKQDDLKVFNEEIRALRELKKEYSLSQDDMIFLLQLTKMGWVYYRDPLISRIISAKSLKKLKTLGFIEYKSVGGDKYPYFAKLTEEGVSFQKQIRKMMERNKTV